MRRLVLAVALLAVLSAQGQQAEDPAHAAARRRQERFKTLEATFKRVDEVRKGAVSDMIGPTMEKRPAMPATGIRFESANRILLDGKRFRYEDRHPVFDIGSGVWEKPQAVYLTDGKLAKSLILMASSDKHIGRIEGTPRCHYATDIVISPLAYYYRGADPLLCPYPIPRFKATGEKQMVAGQECLCYSLANGRIVLRALIDPSLDYAVRRMQQLRNGKLETQVDISYGPLGGFAVFPTAWTVAFMNPAGRLRETRQITVLDVRVPESVPHSEFEVEFPPNTLYHDNRDNVTYEINAAGKAVPSGLFPAPSESSRGFGWERTTLWIAGVICLISWLLYVVLSRKKKIAR